MKSPKSFQSVCLFTVMACQRCLFLLSSMFTTTVFLQSQYDTVLRDELPRVLDAFKRVPNSVTKGKLYRPTLTIIVCGKRHHAKLFPDRSEFADKNGNTRPGTVVDKGITSVYVFFIAVSPSYLNYLQLRFRLLPPGTCRSPGPCKGHALCCDIRREQTWCR